MKITVTSGFFPVWLFGRRLKKMGFKKNKHGMHCYWQRHLDDDKIDRAKDFRKFCRCHLLRFTLFDDSMERSTNYRSVFLKRYNGLFGTGIYLCAYCHSPVRRSKMTVDHVVSVYNARTNEHYRNILKRLSMHNVNDVRNLAPSCQKCNSRKSSNGGFWIFRGYFGKSALRVLLLETIELIFGAVLFRFLYVFLYNNVYMLLASTLLKY